eukprot:15421697-Alexandrium_andersonii.AAC.1
MARGRSSPSRRSSTRTPRSSRPLSRSSSGRSAWERVEGRGVSLQMPLAGLGLRAAPRAQARAG